MGNHAAKLTFTNGKTLEFRGPADITKETTDAIVNAANSSLAGGGGVDGAIHRAAGRSILEECQRIIAKIGHLPAGKAAMTTGGRLPAKYVIHTVGPRYRDGNSGEAKILARCYRESLRIADDHQVRSISFPSISTGIYGYPVEEAAAVAVRTLVDALPVTTHVQQACLILFDDLTCRAYIRAAEQVASESSSNPIIFETGPS